MEKDRTIQDLSLELYSYLSSRFPVCCASDEYVFFPQAVEENRDWSRWDDLSPDSVEDAVAYLNRFQLRVKAFQSSGVDSQQSLISLVSWTALNLLEQLSLVRTHATQPTFPLTVATVGLIQALQSGDEHALIQRLQGLPLFLSRALSSLSSVPDLYRELGVEMAEGIIRWLRTLGQGVRAGQAEEALDSYARRISGLPVITDFRIERDLFERIVKIHSGSGLSVKDALLELEEEATGARQLLIEEAGKLRCRGDWESVYQAIPGDAVPVDGKQGLLNLEIARLRNHCRHLGFLDKDPFNTDKIAIEPLPGSLATVRAADSYNAVPGHPFRGGVFYIFGGGGLGSSSGSIHPVYRMTAAHETYPGHHLLDLFRWNNPEAALRPLEYPLFYEGWACFGEDLMLSTRAFDRPYDRLILLRRRFRHAVRGKADLLLHSGEIDLEKAASELVTAGFSPDMALETVRKYALRPAYQMCYTIGRRRFQRFFDTYGQRDIPGFVSTVLRNGELLFKDLEKILEQTMGNSEITPLA